jgi:prepilin signal peptidase PulO-like enzyme (type II secretory pathway)
MPLLLSIASTTALAAVVTHTLMKGEVDRSALLPFGPFLALGTLVTWFSLVLA